MRISFFYPNRGVPHPATRDGHHTSFHEDRGFDIFFVGGVTYVCKDGGVGIYTAFGASYASGTAARKLIEDFNKKWPHAREHEVGDSLSK